MYNQRTHIMKSLQNLLNEAISNQDSTLCLVKVSNSDGSAWYKEWGIVCIPNEYLTEAKTTSRGIEYKLTDGKEEEFKKLYNTNKIPYAVIPDVFGDDKLYWDPMYYNYTIEKLDQKAANDIMLEWKGIARDAEFFADRVNSLSKYGK